MQRTTKNKEVAGKRVRRKLMYAERGLKERKKKQLDDEATGKEQKG